MGRNLYCEECYDNLYGKDKEKKYEISYEKFICSKCGRKKQMIVNIHRNNDILKDE